MIWVWDEQSVKTYQTIISAIEANAQRVLIICPSSVKINWQREIECFCKDVSIISSKNWKQSRFTIINFDILSNFHTIIDKKKDKEVDITFNINRELVKANFDLLIVDEAHCLKNKDAMRSKVVMNVVKLSKIERIWLLTGTPIANRPMDYYNLLKLIKNPITDNWKFFATRYCDARKMVRTLKNGQKKQIYITDGASNLDELRQKTKNSVLRRLKTEVLDMPDKIVVPVYHELDEEGWSKYNELWNDYIEKRKLEGKNTNLQKDLVELILLGLNYIWALACFLI